MNQSFRLIRLDKKYECEIKRGSFDKRASFYIWFAEKKLGQKG
jgi:hypothetical protein